METAISRENHPGAPTEQAYLNYDKVDGNAFAIMGAVQQALEHAGASKEYCNLVIKDMMSGDYDHLLQVAMAEVEYEPEDDQTFYCSLCYTAPKVK